MTVVDTVERNVRPTTSRWFVLSVVAVGLVVTGGLTYASRANYIHQESRLTALQSSLVANALSSAPLDIERRLGAAVSAASESSNPGVTFAHDIESSLTTHAGPFTGAGLALVTGGRVTNLVHVGAKPIVKLTSATAEAFFRKSAHSPLLITGFGSAGTARRLTFGLSEPSRYGTLVAYSSEALPSNGHFTVPRSNPESAFNLAIYYGNSTAPSQLLLTNAPSTPITGTVSVAHVPFGSSSLTIVSAPRTTIAGNFAENLPWAILGAGLLLTVLFAILVDRLRRRELVATRFASTVADYAGSLEGLYREQRNIAQTLQHALVPPTMPKVAGLEFAARYVPGEEGIEVGGDWYDVIPIGNGVIVSVGDVSGRGLPAASMMAALRFAIRAHATYGLSPGEILTQLAARSDYSIDGHFATVVIANIDPLAGVAVVASAGHLPPIFIDGHHARALRVANGVPIGMGPVDYREEKFNFPPEAALLLYTDGLVERRGVVLDDSVNGLVTLCSEVKPLDAFLDRLMDTLIVGDQRDDTAVLAIGRTS